MWYEMQLDWLLLFLPLICSTPGSRGCWQALVFCTATGSPSEGWSKPALAGLYWVSWVGGEVGGQPEEKGEQKVPECFLLGISSLWIVLFNTFADYSVWYYIVFFCFFFLKENKIYPKSIWWGRPFQDFGVWILGPVTYWWYDLWKINLSFKP